MLYTITGILQNTCELDMHLSRQGVGYGTAGRLGPIILLLRNRKPFRHSCSLTLHFPSHNTISAVCFVFCNVAVLVSRSSEGQPVCRRFCNVVAAYLAERSVCGRCHFRLAVRKLMT